MTKFVCPRSNGQEIACAALQAPEMAMDKTMLSRALEVIERVLTEGAKTHPPNDWREKGVLGNLDHAHGHELLFRHGDNQEEDNLAHAATRFMMALQLREEGKDDTTE
ncbi:MAG: hypothetical protein KQI62_09120 [Deltaproteobacteria bacterium]|nr:hypothetical protein [Deltaproteobacteria bacterium]